MTQIESWIEEILEKGRETPPPSGAEPLDLRELEGALRMRRAPDLPPTGNQDAA